MEMPSSKDWRTLNDVSLELHSSPCLEQLAGSILNAVQKLIPFDGGTVQDDRGGVQNIPWFYGEKVLWKRGGNANDPTSRGLRVMAQWGPNFLPLREAFFEVSADHHPHTDYYRRTGDGGALRICDLMPRSKLQATRFFNEIMRPQGMRSQLTIYMPLPGVSTLMVAAGRQLTDFSDRERMLLNLLRPHIAIAWDRTLPKIPRDCSETQRLFALTPREVEILRWLAQGKRNAEIAKICGVATTTVETHLKNVFAKLGVETRTAAAAMASELGYVVRKN